MATTSVSKTAVGRQAQLPLARAFKISINSLKIRFWRSMVTAGGIFLGIAFLATVLTQWLMQWPVPTKVDAGMVQLDGQLKGPGFQEVYKPIPIEVGKEAGIPVAVIERTKLPDGVTFTLTGIVQGKLQEVRAQRNLARVNKEWEQLSRFQKDMPIYAGILAGLDTKVANAVKAGIPERIAKKVAGASPTFKGADMVDLLREEQPRWLKPLYLATALDQDISVADADRAGVPIAIARHLAGSGKAFKGTALNDAITVHPTWINIWKARVKRYAVYTTAPEESINKLAKTYAINLNQALVLGKNPDMKTADLGNIMIVNPNGRKIGVSLVEGVAAGNIPLASGDYVLVPDCNSKYRMWWLVGMSLLVCTVGIMNSMLMAVTERFKEIGTMKCLGALDSFVVLLLVLESSMLGICASTMGWLVGFVAMVLIAGTSKGWDMVATMNPMGVLATFGICVVAGIAITLVATILPAMQAAKMPAAMALRSEI